MTLTASSDTVSLGQNIHVDGRLLSTKGSLTSYLGYARVSLAIILPDGTIAYPTQGSTISTTYDGKFAMDLAGKVAGKYQFEASYAGDMKHSSVSKAISITVIDTRPPAVEVGSSSISLTVSSSQATTGQTLHADGTLTCAFLSGSVTLANAKVAASVILPNGGSAAPIQGSALLTSSDGKFSMDYLASSAGAYKFVASYSGDSTHTSVSKEVSFTVSDPVPIKSASSMALTLASSSIVTGQSMHASGTLTGSSGIPGAAVSLRVTLPAGTTDYPTQGASTTTDSSGVFAMDYTPSAVGTYKFTANFAGNANYLGSSINATFSVVAPTGGASEFTGVIYQTFTTSSYSVDAINSALASCPNGQAVKLAAGTYILNGMIVVPSGKTLVGSTDGKGGIATIISTNLQDSSLKVNGYIYIGSGGNTVRNIKTMNGYYFFGTNSHDFLIQDCEYNGPTDSAAGQYYLCGFFVYIANNGNYDNGCFLRCIVKNAPCYGFIVCSDSSKNSNHLGANAYSAHAWSWTDCEAYNCGIANINYPAYFVYGCGFNFFEGFGVADDVVGMRVTNCIANANAADGFHIEYWMDITDFVFQDCTANNNGQWFFLGHTTDPFDGVLIGTGFYLGGSLPSQMKVLNCLAQNNWGFSTNQAMRGAGMVNSQLGTDLNGYYVQGTGAC